MASKHQTARNRTTRQHGQRQAGRERLEADGLTHRRDCECARCDAGFVPTEGERETAARRSAARRGRLAAARAFERKKEMMRLKQLALAAYFTETNMSTDAEVRRLRELRARTLADRRLDELLRLRAEGMRLAEALAEVERRLPTPAGTEADNDNAVRSPPEVPFTSCRVPGVAVTAPAARATEGESLLLWAPRGSTPRSTG
jgi:hypothetical protein